MAPSEGREALRQYRWSHAFHRSRLSPVVFVVAEEFVEPMLEVLAMIGVPLVNRSPKSDNVYSSAALLEGFVIHVHTHGFPAGQLSSGWRVLGFRSMRLLCLLMGLEAPRRALRGEHVVPVEEDLLEALVLQLNEPRAQVRKRAKRGLGIADRVQLLNLVRESLLARSTFQCESCDPSAKALMNGGGLGGWEPGEWTDDTQMAICIAEETATGTVDPVRVAGRFLDWYRSGPADVGVQTASVLSHAENAAGVAASAAEYFRSHPDKSAGNGSLMRTAPLALANLGDDRRLVELATSVSALTHADPVAGEACALWCIAIDRAIREGRLDGARDGIDLLPVERRGYWAERLEEVEAGPPSRFSHNTFVVSAFQAALAAILHTPILEVEPCRHLQEALHAAVRIGDDTDTVAAIAGSLLGARWGASALPVLWRAVLHGKPGVYGRPDYASQDLVRLAVMSARCGESDSTGWPDADDLTRYLLKNWPAPSLVPGLKEDPGVLLGTVFGAATASADVTVSLCRMGRTQVDPVRHPIRIELGLVDGGETANANLDFTFHDLARAIVRWRSEDKAVLVRCVRAEHRTPAVGAAYPRSRGCQAEKRFDACVPSSRRPV